MSKLKSHIAKGDTAEVIAGNHKGKSGLVLDVNVKKQQVTLEGVRLVKKTIKRSEQTPDGGIVEQDAPIALSNVKKVTA